MDFGQYPVLIVVIVILIHILSRFAKKKCWDGRLEHFWPKVLESSIPTLFAQNFFCTGFFYYVRC